MLKIKLKKHTTTTRIICASHIVSEWKAFSALILPKIASRVLHQSSKKIVSVWPARAADRSHREKGKKKKNGYTACPHTPLSLSTEMLTSVSPWWVATCTVIHLLNFQRETLVFSHCLGDIPFKLFCYLLSIPSLKTSQLEMATESLTRARLQMHGAITRHSAIRYTLVCTHMPAFISHSGWKLQGARAAFLLCCLHNT